MSTPLASQSTEKNSASSDGSANPLVIAQNLDGSGAIITLSSVGTDAVIKLSWVPGPNNPAPPTGSITIELVNAGNLNLTIRGIPICLNGVSGTIYGLFSDFVPDP